MNTARAFIGLGANLGDARRTLAAAFEAIGGLPATRLVRKSSLYASAPIDAGGPDYVNAVAEVSTALEPLELLRALMTVEAAHGRQRSVRNAPRTLDLDLLVHGSDCLETTELTLPHPRLHLRAFVLEPLLEIAPGLCLPGPGPLEPWRLAASGQRISRLAD